MINNQEEIMPNLSEDVTGSTVETVSTEEVVESAEMSAIKAMAANVQEILVQVQDFTYKDKINRELHTELQSCKSGQVREIMAPLLKNIILWHGTVIDQYNHYVQMQSKENTNLAALFPDLLKEYKKLANGLEDLLYDYDIETETPIVGDEFNPRTQKKSPRTVETDDDALVGKVAECINAGFRDIVTTRLLKQPEVAVYQKKP